MGLHATLDNMHEKQPKGSVFFGTSERSNAEKVNELESFGSGSVDSVNVKLELIK